MTGLVEGFEAVDGLGGEVSDDLLAVDGGGDSVADAGRFGDAGADFQRGSRGEGGLAGRVDVAASGAEDGAVLLDGSGGEGKGGEQQ